MISLLAEALAFSVAILFAIWTMRKLRNVAFSLAAPLVLVKPSICNRRNIHRGV
jgi:hypothetical protein